MAVVSKKVKCHHCPKTYVSKENLRNHLSRVNINIDGNERCKKAVDEAIAKAVEELDAEPAVLEEAAEELDLEEAAVQAEAEYEDIEVTKEMNNFRRKLKAVKKSKRALTDRVKYLEKLIPVLEECRKMLGKATQKSMRLEAELKTLKEAIKNPESEGEMQADPAGAARDAGVLLCNLCPYMAKTEQELKGHKKFEHLKCKVCKTTHFSLEKLKEHLVKEHPQCPVCRICKIVFTGDIEFKAHLAIKHPNHVVKYQCMECKQIFNTDDDRSRHINTRHAKKDDQIETVWDCFMCGKIEKSQNELNVHINGHLDQPTTHEQVTGELTNCRNGDNCRFLRQNRCKFYHEVAEQVQEVHSPEEQWQTAQPRRKRQQQASPQPQALSGVPKSVTLNPVKWCNLRRNCHKGAACAFWHMETVYNKNFPTPQVQRRG